MAETGSIFYGDRFLRRPSACRVRLWKRVRVSVASDCAAPLSRWIFATVVVIELARLIWAERIDEPSHGSHAHCGDNGSLGPPISVLTHPGLTKTQVMPRGAKSNAALHITMFTAALELR